MKIYRTQNVYDAALERIRWLFDEFPNIVASVSGGKDSTVIFHLCLQVAREKGRLPLKVFWLDQEAEWQATVDQVSEWMHHPDVDPMWMQFPFKLFNATSVNDHWLDCWNPEKQDMWVHPQVEMSYKENKYGTDRFHELFEAISVKEFPHQKTCYIAGVRCEESPLRYVALTDKPKYKWITWAKMLSKKHQHFTFYPLYDWSYTDVWKAILDSKWSYCRLYDAQYRYGIPLKRMRVSNVHHETAVNDLFYIQEIEADTYERLVHRISGIDMAGKMGFDNYFVTNLPTMFENWREYRDYLLKNLIVDDVHRKCLQSIFDNHDRLLGDAKGKYKAHVKAIMVNDWEGVTLDNFRMSPNHKKIRDRMRAQND